MRKIGFIIIVFLKINAQAQSLEMNTTIFYDTLVFNQTIVYNKAHQIDHVQYDEINGELRKIEYYNSKRRICRDKIWKKTLIRETEYKYIENNQVVERYDVTNKRPLPTQLNVYFKYLALARENEIQGRIEVKIDYNNECVPVAFIILNSLSYGIDKEVREKIKLMMALAKKYNVSFAGCKEAKDNFQINFKLE